MPGAWRRQTQASMRVCWPLLLCFAASLTATEAPKNCSSGECDGISTSHPPRSSVNSHVQPTSPSQVSLTSTPTTANTSAPTSTAPPDDAFQRRLKMLLKEQRLVLAPTASQLRGNTRKRRAVGEKANEVWAVFQKKTSATSEPTDERPPPPERNECPATFYRGIKWPATQRNRCSQMDCPTGNVGIMTWCCNGRGYWKSPSPNTAQCVQPSVLKLKSQIATEGRNRRYLADIIEAVSVFVGNNSLEVGGDLVAIVDLLDTGVVRSESGDIYPGHIPSASVAERVGNLTARTVDALLSHDKPWNEVPAQTRYSCATTLLLIMDVAGIILSITSNEDEENTLAFKNFQMNIMSSTTTHIANQTMQLPGPGTIFNRTHSTAQLRLARDASGDDHVSHSGDGGTVVIVFTEFPRLDKLLQHDGVDTDAGDPKQELNSPVISIRVGSEAKGLVLGAHVEMALPMLQSEAENPTCVFWDTLINEWSPDGCTVGRRNSTHVVCFCRHLSNFAVLMDLRGVLNNDARASLPFRLITWIGCSTSGVCLCLCVVVFGCFRSLRNTRTSIHLNLCLCLLVAEVVLMFGLDQTKHKVDTATICNELLCAFSTLLVLLEVRSRKPHWPLAGKFADCFKSSDSSKPLKFYSHDKKEM